jgi:hypothetical protein
MTLLNDNFHSINPQQLVGGDGTGPATIFLPSFQGSQRLDFELRGGDPSSDIRVFSVANPDTFPLPMVVALPENISSLPTHNTLTMMQRFKMH